MTGVFNAKKSAIWHAIVPIYGAMTVIIMDMSPWIAQIRYHCLAHWHITERTLPTGMIDPHLGLIATPDTHTMITRTDTGSVIPNVTHIAIETGVSAISTLVEATWGHSTDLPNAVSHATEVQAPTDITVTHCTADLHLIDILPKMTAEPGTNPKNNITNQHKDPHPPHKQHPGNKGIEDTSRSPLMTPPSEYYSSGDHDSDSGAWFKLEGPSPTVHSRRGLPNEDIITIAHITDCPTVTVHAGKCYQALIDSGAAISLIRQSTYKQIKDCYKTSVQPMAAKLNTADGSPMTT